MCVYIYEWHALCDHCHINFPILQRWPDAQEKWINVLAPVWKEEEYISEIHIYIYIYT
jgi:hypothetical protein